MSSASQQEARISLANYTTCDVSDVLLKLRHPRGGFLPGITMWSPQRQAGDVKLVGPAYTVKFVDNRNTEVPKLQEHYIDTVPADAVIFISAPPGIPHAVYGGLMSHRAKWQGASGTVIDGNFRDLDEQRLLDYAVFARQVATPPYYEAARASEVNVPVEFGDGQAKAAIEPEDFIMGDMNGVVHIPKSLLQEVLRLLPSVVEADTKVAVAIDKGATFAEAVKQYRG